MNLGELIVDLSLDYAEFTQSLEQAKRAASTAAASIEKSFQKISLSTDIDDKPFTDLNQQINISVQHLKQANTFFKNNPLTTYVNDDSLTDLNDHLKIKVDHLKEANKFYTQNPITVRTNTSQLDELEERLDRLGNRKVTMEVDTIVLSQFQDKTAEVVEQAISNAIRQMQAPQSGGQSAQQSQPQQQNRVQRVQMGLDPLRSIGEGVFENVGKQLSKGVGSSMQDSLGVDMKSFTQIASNSVLRYFGVGKKAQKDPKDNKSKIKSIVEDAIKDYSTAVNKGSGSIRGELDDVDLSSVDAIAKNSLLRYFGVGKKAQSDPKNNRAKIKSIIEDAVQQYSGTEVKKENSGVISSTLSEINKAFSETVNKSVQGIAERAKAATIKEVRRASTSVLANSSSGVRDSVNSLFDAAESGKSGKKGSVGQYIGRSLASQSRKAVEGTFSNLFPTVAPIVKEFLSTANKPLVEKQAPKQRPADGLLEAANQLKEAAKAISESAVKVQSVAPVIYEQIADPWGSADLTPVQVPLKPAKQKTKKDDPEPELVLLEFPQQTQQHFKTLNTEVGKNTAKSLEFLKATTQENIKQQTAQSIANIKAALDAINQYFRAEYKQVKDAVDNAKATGHIDDINAARSAAKNYQRRSSGAIQEVDRIIKSGEDAGFSKEFGSELSQVHATGKRQLVASDNRVGHQLGGLDRVETNQFKKDVKLYTELAKKAGIEIDAGLIKGLDIGSSGVSAEARDLLNGLVDTVKKTMGIQSPSRVMMAIGAMIAAGLGLGIKNSFNTVLATSKDKFSSIFESIKEQAKVAIPKIQNILSSLQFKLEEASVFAELSLPSNLQSRLEHARFNAKLEGGDQAQSEQAIVKEDVSFLGRLLPAIKKDFSADSVISNLLKSGKKAFTEGGSFKDIGINLITSFGKGILSSDDGVFAILGTFAKSAIGLVKKIFGIASPSKIFYWIGLMLGLGLEEGAMSSLSKANQKITGSVKATTNNAKTIIHRGSLGLFGNVPIGVKKEVSIGNQVQEADGTVSGSAGYVKNVPYTINDLRNHVEDILSVSKNYGISVVPGLSSILENNLFPTFSKAFKTIKSSLANTQKNQQVNPQPAYTITPNIYSQPTKLNALQQSQNIYSQPTKLNALQQSQATVLRPPNTILQPLQSNPPRQSQATVLRPPNTILQPLQSNPPRQSQATVLQPNWTFYNPPSPQPVSAAIPPQKITQLQTELANNVISAVSRSINQTRMSGNATLGQFMRNAVMAAGTAMSGTLIGTLTEPLKALFPRFRDHVKTIFPMIMKAAIPIAGVAALKLGDATTGNLLKNGIFKQGGFLTELLSAFSGIKLGSMGGAGIKSAISGITEFLSVFPMLSPLASIGTMAANAGVAVHNIRSGGGGGGGGKSINTVLEDKTAENLKEAGLNSTGNSTIDLVENLAETTVGALFRMIGFEGIKASAVQALIKDKVKEHSGEIANAVGGVGNGQVSALIDGYVKGDSTQLAGTAESMLKNMGITGLDPKQIKLAANAITATLSGLHAKFGQEGFNLGNSISKGFKGSLNNLANAKDDLEYNLKKAVGKASAGDVIGNIFKRMSRGFVVDKGMFDEMWNQVGSAFKKGAFKGMSGNEQEGMFGNMMGFMASASAMLAPITTMAASLAPLFIPLAPIIAGIGGAIRMVMPQLSKLFEGMQRVEQLQRRFTFLGGSKAGGVAELNYAKGVANQMNVPAEVAANAYSQLAIAARGTKMEGQGVKDLFEGITASLSALGIGGHDASLVFMAYTQMMSKGKISMEELRQQLGEKFPPAMGAFAKAMGVSVSEMNDLVSSGSVLSQDLFPKLSKVLNADYGKSAASSTGSLSQALTKLGNIGFEVTTVFTDKLAGSVAGFVNMFSSGLELLKNSLGTLIPLGQSFVIGFTATIAVGLTVMMTKIKPVVVLLGSLQSLLLSTFSAIASNLMPMIIGITSDVADGWLGAESDLMKNMYDGVNNMIVGLFSMVDSGARALSNKPLFAEGLIGGESVNLVVAGIDAIKGALSAVFSVIPPGVVELGALVFMFEQAIALGSMALGPALVGGAKALWGMILGIKNAFVGTMGTAKIWGELMMTSMNAGAVATEKAAARAMIANEGWKMSLIALRSMSIHVAAAMAVLMFSKGDFSNPLGDKISETSKKVTVNLNNMKSAALSLGEAFDKAAGQLTNLNNKLVDTLPSKGVQLDIRNFWDKTKSTTSDDLIRNSNRAEVERRQREKDGKQTFGDRLRGFNEFTRNITASGRLVGWGKDRLVPKTDDATIDLVKKYGLEKYIAPDKNLRIDMAQSQVIKALQDSEANTKALATKLSSLGLTKQTQQNYLIPEKMGPVGNTFDIDAQLKDVKDKLKELDKVRASLVVFNQRGSNLFTSPEQIEARKKDYGINSTALTSLGLNSDADNVYDRDIEAQKNILAERMKQLENQRASTAQGVERFKSNKEIQLIDAQILDKVKRGVQLEKANPSDATRKELGGINAAVLELKTRREKIINGMGSDVKDNQEALNLLVQHKKDILDGTDEATKAFSMKIRRVIAKNVDQQIELVKNALEIAQKSVPAQFGDDLYQKAANKLRDTQIAFDRTGSANKIASLNFSASVNGSSERSANITPILANRQVADLEKQQKDLDNLTKGKKETIDAYAAILRYGANKDVKDELEKLKADVLKDDESLAQLRNDINTAKRGIRQALVDQTKQVADYYRTAVREAQAVSIEFQKAQKTLENSRMQNKLREALIGAGDNIYTQFIEGIINIISQTSEIEKQQLEAKKQRIDYENNVQDIQLQAAELQRSLPGKIIPLDSSMADNFNLSLEDINGTVNTINGSVKGVASSLSSDVVDAAKKANAELDKLNQSIKNLDNSSNSWIEGFGSKFADLVKSFENGFDGVGTAIAGMGIKTSDWLASLATGQGLIQSLAGGVSAVFGEKAGQQLEQGAKELVSNPIGALKQFFGVNNGGKSIFDPQMINDGIKAASKFNTQANMCAASVKAFTDKVGINTKAMDLTADSSKRVGTVMTDFSKIKPGDLIGWSGTSKFGDEHIGVYIDGQKIFHQSGSRGKKPGVYNDFDYFKKQKGAYFVRPFESVLNTTNTKQIQQRQPVPKVPPVPGLDPRIDTKFLQSVGKIAQSVGAKPEDLLKTMLYETGGTLSPSARNRRTNATGLIQFMPATARGLGTNINALSQMSPQDQLVFVQKYLKQNSRGQKLDSFQKVLSTVFAGNPNASLGVGDGDITLGNYLKKAERYGNTARQLAQIAMQGGSIQPNQMQQAVTQAGRLKLNTAAQQYQTNQINSSLSPEQIKNSQLQQTLERDKYILQARTGARTFDISTKERSFGTEKFVAEGIFPNMSNLQQYIVKREDLIMNLNKRESELLNIIDNTPDPSKLTNIRAAFEKEMRPRFKDDPAGLASVMAANDLKLNNAVNDRNAAIKELQLLRDSRTGIIQSFQADFNKKEGFRFKEQSTSEQTKVIDQLQQQLQLVQKLDEIDPLNPLVLSIPALQRNHDLLSINRDQYQQLLDLQKRYYDGGGKGGNMSEEAFQKEFNAIVNVNSAKKEGVDLNFNYANTVKRIKFATDELTKAQTLQSSQMKSLELDNERFAIDNKNGLVSIIGLTNELTMKTNELTNAYKRQLLEIEGDVLLNKPGDRLLARLRANRNYRQGVSNIGAEFESKKTEAELVTNPQVELSRKEKLISSDNAIAAERIRGNELFGVRSRDMQKMQALSQINMDFEREKIEIERFGQANKDSAEEVQILLNNLNKLNKLKLDNLSKEFNIFTEVISGIKGDMEGIFKSFILDNSSKNTEGIQSANKSLDDIKKKRVDTVMNTSDNIVGVGSSYKSPNTELLKYLDVAQKDLESKKDELNKINIGEFFGEIGKSILNNLAGVVSKELSNQLFGSLTGFLFGKIKEDGSAALNTAGVNLQGSATSLQTSAMMLRDAAIAMNAGSAAKAGGGGILGSILSIFGGGTPTNSGLGADGSFIGDIIPNESYNMAFNGGMVGKLSTFANDGIVGAMNKERSITGRTPHLIVASEGERILNHRQTKRFEELQMERVLNYASGGVVGSPSTPNMSFTAPSQSSTVNINVPVTVQGGQSDASVNVPQLQNAIRSAVLSEIQRQQRPGGALGR